MTSNEGKENTSDLEDRDKYTGNDAGNNSARNAINEWDLIVHGLPEGYRDMSDEQLIKWLLETVLRLKSYSKYVEEFGRAYKDYDENIPPILVKVSTVDIRVKILRQAENLVSREDLEERMYIVPFLSDRGMKETRNELNDQLPEFQDEYQDAEIQCSRIVRFENEKMRVLYTPKLSRFARNEWNLVFHRLPEEADDGMPDEQRIKWLLEDVLGLESYSQYVEKFERLENRHEYNFTYIPPIQVQMSTVEICGEILRRAENLIEDSGEMRMYIDPFVSEDDRAEIRKELDAKLREYEDRNTYAENKFWRIVQFVGSGRVKVLYTPKMFQFSELFEY